MNHSMQWQLLAAGAAAGTLTAEEGVQLLALCRESAEAREALVRVMAVERLLPLAAGDPDGILAAKEVVMRLEEGAGTSIEVAWRAAERARNWLWLRRLRGIGGALAAMLVVGCLLLWAIEVRKPAASWSRAEGLTWVGRPPSLAHGDLPRGARLQASAGLLELGFGSGARMVLEGPFDIELRHNMKVVLHSGRISVRCPVSAHGFTVETSYGSVVDKGTEFCVQVLAGRRMEVHVLEGLVEALVPGKSPISLLKGDALRSQKSGAKRIAANEGAFVTALPVISGEPARFIHWSFDEGSGSQAGNTGRSLGAEVDTRLLFKTPVGQGKSGRSGTWIRGPFGRALSLDGQSYFAETEFPGIAGNAPRTVALWVRVPRNFQRGQGHGIVSWGTLQQGGAWQLSANELERDGLVGRLRLGTYYTGAIVGTTDLRDGNWHHVAVVMYGGGQREAVKNVLFYIDGKVEPISGKSLKAIDTDVANADHGVWIGRNVAYPTTGKRAGSKAKLFRGDVDEVFIFDSALSQEDIVRLMKSGQPPR